MAADPVVPVTPRRALLPVLLAAVLAWPLTASAHAELRRSVPAPGEVLDAPPQRIVLLFNERVQVTALRLHRGDGREVALPARRAIREAAEDDTPLPLLGPGEYRADWRAISADGHVIRGSIAFRVAPTAADTR